MGELPEVEKVTCGRCGKFYSGSEIEPVWRANTVEWTCPTCGTPHDGFIQGENRIVFRVRRRMESP